MKKILLCCLLLSIMSVQAQLAKKIHITGKVVEKSSAMDLPSVTVSILNPLTNELVFGDVTDDNGLFDIAILPGNYTIKFEYLSFKTYEFKNVKAEKNIDLEVIQLEDDTELLNELVITAEKSTVSYSLDKKVFHVGKDLISKGGTLTDVLDNVPSVSVNVDGAVSLRGNTGVRILIDGKPSILANNNALEQIPAANIDRIEVITNPSSKYESQGTAGIINIILKKKKNTGFGGSVQVTTGTPANHKMNVNVNYKTKKYNLFSNIGYRYENFFGEGEELHTSLKNGSAVGLTQEMDGKRNDNHFNIYLGADYYINSKNIITASLYLNRLKNKDKTTTRYNYLNALGQIDSTVVQTENYYEPQNFNQLDLNYEKLFTKKGQKFTASLKYNFWNDDENEQIERLGKSENGTSNLKIRTRDIESSKDLLLIADFESSLAKNLRFETGLRGEARRINSEYTVFIDDKLMENYDNLLHYDERIFGSYLQLGDKRNAFNYLIGARFEYSNIEISDRENQFSNKKNYLDFFPTAHVGYTISEKSSLQLSYSKRINRPRFWQLNPFGGLSDPSRLFVGNPDLNPMYTHSFELGLVQKWKGFSINPSVYLKKSTNYFQYITIQNQEGVFVTKPVNLDKENRMGVVVSLNYSPFNWWRLSGTYNFYAFEEFGMYQEVDYTTKDHTWTSKLNSRMKFDKGFTVQTSFNFQGENTSGQRHTKAQYWANIGMSKDVLKNKASITLNVSNVFDSRINELFVQGQDYTIMSESKRSGRRISATFTYRFNRKKEVRDRTVD